MQEAAKSLHSGSPASVFVSVLNTKSFGKPLSAWNNADCVKLRLGWMKCYSTTFELGGYYFPSQEYLLSSTVDPLIERLKSLLPEIQKKAGTHAFVSDNNVTDIRPWLWGFCAYVTVLLIFVVFHQAETITLYHDFTDAGINLGAVICGGIAMFMFKTPESSNSLSVGRCLFGGLSALLFLASLRATCFTNRGVIRLVISMAGKLMFSAFGIFLVLLACGSGPTKKDDKETDAEYEHRRQSEERDALETKLLVAAILFAIGKWCVRRHEFAPLSVYFSFDGRKSFETKMRMEPEEGSDMPQNPEEESASGADVPEPEESVNSSNPYTFLGCSPNDSDEKIKKSYRQLVQQYHPDKIAGKDLPQPFVEFAHRRFRAIQDAYEEILEERSRT